MAEISEKCRLKAIQTQVGPIQKKLECKLKNCSILMKFSNEMNEVFINLL